MVIVLLSILTAPNCVELALAKLIVPELLVIPLVAVAGTITPPKLLDVAAVGLIVIGADPSNVTPLMAAPGDNFVAVDELPVSKYVCNVDSVACWLVSVPPTLVTTGIIPAPVTEPATGRSVNFGMCYPVTK
jgi:hypothetical protein